MLRAAMTSPKFWSMGAALSAHSYSYSIATARVRSSHENININDYIMIYIMIFSSENITIYINDNMIYIMIFSKDHDVFMRKYHDIYRRKYQVVYLLVIHSFTFIPYFTLRITGRPTHRIPSYNVTGKLLLA